MNKPKHYLRSFFKIKGLLKKLYNYVYPFLNNAINFHSFLRILTGRVNEFTTFQPVNKGFLVFSSVLLMANNARAQTFLPPLTNPFGLSSPGINPHPALIDLDNDGDLDLMVGNDSGGFLYYENNGTATSPSFIAPVSNPFGLTYTGGVASPTFADLDADGDWDMLSGGGVYSLVYFENTGTLSSPFFSTSAGNPPGLSSNPQPVPGPAFGDVDGDGDMDILVGHYYGSPTFFENTGTVSSPSFGPALSGAFGLTDLSYNCYGVFLDLDMDNDLDWLAGNFTNNLNYFKNSGSSIAPVFDSNVTNPFNLIPGPAGYVAYTVGDLNGDGSTDILGGAGVSSLYYYENSNCQLNPFVILDTTVSSGIALTTNQGVFEYSWVVCPGLTPAPGINDTIPYNLSANGDYAVIVQSGICLDTSACLTINTVEVETAWINEYIDFFPNPANQVLHFVNAKANIIQLLNEQGIIIGEITTQNETELVYEIGGLPNGIYIVRITNEGISRSRKLVVIH